MVTPASPAGAGTSNTHDRAFDAADAALLPSLFQFRFNLIPRSAVFGEDQPPAAAAAVRRYESARANLASCDDLGPFGFHLWHDFLGRDEADQLLAFCRDVPMWQDRQGSTDGGKRMCYGVTLDESYRVVSEEPLPPVIAALGQRLHRFCREQCWPAACTDVAEQPPFRQAYVQRYTDNQTLGFHFDHRREFDELICGVSVCGHGTLLLGATSGEQMVSDVPRTLARKTVRAVELPPLSLYAMSGMARYDLRHAVVHGQGEPRISITFRSLGSRAQRPAGASPRPRPAAAAASAPALPAAVVASAAAAAAVGAHDARPPCPYGARCYRIGNARHLRDFRHADSGVPAAAPAAAPVAAAAAAPAAAAAVCQRQECKYGLACFRDDPQHFVDFDHPAAHPKRQRRA